MKGIDAIGRSSRTRSALVFVLAALSFLYVDFGGKLYVIELAIAVGVVLSIPTANHPKLGSSIAVGLVLWSFGSLLSDLAAESDSLVLVKGLLRVFFLAVDIFALYYICVGDERVVWSLWLGLALSGVLVFFVQPSAYSHGEPWKFGFSLPFTLIVVLWLARRDRSRLLSAAVFLGITAVHFQLGFRSMASVTLIAALLVAVRVPTQSRISDLSFALRLRPAALGVVGVAGVLSLTSVYDKLAEQGSFGYVAQQKAFYQADGAFGSSLSSRSEFLLSVQSIADSPILGGGSYSVANADVTNSAAAFLSNLGYTSVAERLGQGAPAYHSELLGTWAENGVLSLFFWIPFAVLLVRGIFAVVYRETALPELVLFISVLGLWDLFFSPFGADRRMWVAATVVSIVIAAVNSKSLARSPIAGNLNSHH